MRTQNILVIFIFSFFLIPQISAQEQNCNEESLLYDIDVNSEGFFSPAVDIHKDLIVTGKILDGDCKGISNAKIIAEIKRGSDFFSKTVNSNDDGSFRISLETSGLVNHHETYLLYITTVYQGEVNRSQFGNIEFFDIQRFIVTEDGKTAIVEISPSPGSTIASFDFDKDTKKISLELEHFENESGQFRIAIPHNLLSGDITVIRDGGLVFTLTQENLIGDDVVPNTDFKDTDNRFSYSLRGRLIENYTSIIYNFIPQETSKLEIVGTTAIPEFGIIATMILASSVLPIALLRKQLKEK